MIMEFAVGRASQRALPVLLMFWSQKGRNGIGINILGSPELPADDVLYDHCRMDVYIYR